MTKYYTRLGGGSKLLTQNFRDIFYQFANSGSLILVLLIDARTRQLSTRTKYQNFVMSPSFQDKIANFQASLVLIVQNSFQEAN